MSPAPAPKHQHVSFKLQALLYPLVRPHGAVVCAAVAVRVSDEDGPVPDLAVVAEDVIELSGAVPLASSYTMVEIVSPSVLWDRSYKPELYAEAGIACYRRVELKASRRYQGPLPLIVVQALEKDGETWRTVEAPAGEAHDLPLAVGPDAWITVTLDPAELVAP
jgi:hypothetical protein